MGEGENLVVVEAAQQHAVDLDRAQAGSLRRADAGQHFAMAAGNAGDAVKGGCVHRIHAHRNPLQARVDESLRQAGQEMAVGGQRQVEGLVVGGSQQSQLPQHGGQVGAQQGFAAGQPEFVDAE